MLLCLPLWRERLWARVHTGLSGNLGRVPAPHGAYLAAAPRGPGEGGWKLWEMRSHCRWFSAKALAQTTLFLPFRTLGSKTRVENRFWLQLRLLLAEVPQTRMCIKYIHIYVYNFWHLTCIITLACLCYRTGFSSLVTMGRQ